jgi:hypothetical protein
MTRFPARNALLVIGAWEASNLLAILIRVLLNPLSNRLIFTGNAGNVAMWLWGDSPMHSLRLLHPSCWCGWWKRRGRWSGSGFLPRYFYTAEVSMLGS